MQDLRRVPPPTLKDLVEAVEDFGESLDPAELRAAARDVKKRAGVCKRFFPGPFDYKLKNKEHTVCMVFNLRFSFIKEEQNLLFCFELVLF